MRLFIYLASAVGRVNKLDAFFRFIIALVGEWNNKTAAERRQMFLIGSLLAREGTGSRRQRVVLGSRLLQSSFDAQMLVKMIFCIFFKGCRKSQTKAKAAGDRCPVAAVDCFRLAPAVSVPPPAACIPLCICKFVICCGSKVHARVISSGTD